MTELPIIHLRPTYDLSGVSLDFPGADFRVQPNALDLDVTLYPLLKGDKGEAGSAGGASYTHDQMNAATVWYVAHNLNRHPSVVVTDSSGRQVEGDVVYVDANHVTITFSAAFAGLAYFN